MVSKNNKIAKDSKAMKKDISVFEYCIEIVKPVENK